MVAIAGCDDRSRRDVHADIQVILKRNDVLVPAAERRLVERGRLAITQIETAMHAASPRAKVRLCDVLSAIGDPEAVAIFRHMALYEPADEARLRAAAHLTTWARANDLRGGKARAALAWVQEQRHAGHGPVAKRLAD
jgi:hypothetical protein